MMTQIEHLKWCKDRSIEIVNSGDTYGGYASFVSDMGIHPETAGHVAIPLGIVMLATGQLKRPDEMAKFIRDFN